MTVNDPATTPDVAPLPETLTLRVNSQDVALPLAQVIERAQRDMGQEAFEDRKTAWKTEQAILPAAQELYDAAARNPALADRLDELLTANRTGTVAEALTPRAPGDDADHLGAPQPELVRLKLMVEQLQQRDADRHREKLTTSLEANVDRELGNLPLFTDTPEMQELGRSLAMDAMVRDPELSPQNAAALVHERLNTAVTARETAERNSRRSRAEQAVMSAKGSPQIAPVEKPTFKTMKAGGIKDRIMQSLSSIVDPTS
jgi:hypothetical protein